MESKFQTSFIPKDSFDNGNVTIKTPISILFVSSVIVLLLTLGVSLGVFFYQKFLENNIAKEQAMLSQKQNDLDSSKATIGEIVSVDSKLKIAQNLLNSHTAISSLFTLLQAVTLKNVSFSSFSFDYVSPTQVTVSMKGQATGFEVVARQVEAFASSTLTGGSFKDPIFSDVNLGDKGNVNFSLLTNIDPGVVLYTNTLSTSTINTKKQ